MSEEKPKCDKSELTNRIEELNSEKTKLFNQLYEIFKLEMKNFLIENNCVHIRCHINNHEWNDGCQTYFSFGWDYADLQKEDDSEEEEVSLDFCREYPDDFWEFHLSEHYESVYFRIKDGELDIY